jgi:outer membrane protein OmpA-like peptidoglycan-associated protein
LEAGSAVYLERGYQENPEVFPAFSGGLSAGWRFNLGGNWYVEPAARVGYPYIWGFGVTAGIKFKGTDGNQKTVAKEHKKEIEEGDVIDDMKVVKGDDGNLRLQVFSIMFRNDQADFTGLSDETVKNNYETIKHVAELLNRYKNYRIIIEGHANPTTAEGRAREREKDIAIRLSEQRALKVMDILKEFGVSPDRMRVVGAGFSKMIAPYNDGENNWKNRRVEIILIRE